jgi:hypothetical protein
MLGIAGYLFAPVHYASTGMIRVPPSGAANRAAVPRETDGNALPDYEDVIRTHAILVRSRRVVEEAAGDAEVRKLAPGRSLAPAAIVRSLTARVEPGTELIIVTCAADDPTTAIVVANAILRAHERVHGPQPLVASWGSTPTISKDLRKPMLLSGFVAGLAIYALAMVGVPFAARKVRASIRRRKRQCPGCGYMLVDSALCPECGNLDPAWDPAWEE